MNSIHHNAIKYLTYLALNKRKIDNKQAPVPPPQQTWITSTTPLEPTSQRRHNTLCCIMIFVINIRPMGSHSCWYLDTSIIFIFIYTTNDVHVGHQGHHCTIPYFCSPFWRCGGPWVQWAKTTPTGS